MKNLLFVLYGFFLLAFTFCTYFFIDPNISYLNWFYLHFQLGSHILKVALLFSILIIFFLFYLFILFLYMKKTLTMKDGMILIAMTIIFLMVAYPAVYSYDIFNYIATAKVAFLYKENPYVIMPIEFTGEPLLRFMHAPNKVALYGPVWLLFTFIPYIFGNGNFIVTLFLFKGLVVIFYILLLLFIYKLTHNFFSVLFVALNPLVVIETIISGHNDAVMMALFLASLYYFLRARIFIGSSLFILSVFIKYATLFLAPVFLVFSYLYKQKNIKRERLMNWLLFGMIGIFLLSSFREEIYPWYALWFLPFVAIIGRRRDMLIAILFTFCLELRYFPYMILLTHFGPTPYLKLLITFLPLFMIFVFLYAKRICGKISFHFLR